MGKHLPASYVDTAIARYQRDGQLEIDDNAEVSASDNGAYVQCWLWNQADLLYYGFCLLVMIGVCVLLFYTDGV